MKLNTLKPASHSRPKKLRVGRGIGSGRGKTCGRGHKGQLARSGGLGKRVFEGGQMPLTRRLPKFGFYSQKAKYIAEVRLSELENILTQHVDLSALKSAGIIAYSTKVVKIFCCGAINKPLIIKGLKVTKGARLAIEAAGGKIEE